MLMVVKANSKLPSVTAQDVGRELYYGRQEIVQIIGDRRALDNIAWIFQKVPDMFDIEFKYASLVVRRAQKHPNSLNVSEVNTYEATQAFEGLSMAKG